MRGRRNAAIGFDQRPPGSALAVDRPVAADGDVVQALAADEALRISRAAGVFVDGEHLQHRAAGQARLILSASVIGPQKNSPAGTVAQSPAASRAGRVDRRLDRLGIIRQPRGRSVIGDLENRLGYLRQVWDVARRRRRWPSAQSRRRGR